ncbi:MAG: hypothetical protein U0556_18975 [Dehalococcoidia bacterium]
MDYMFGQNFDDIERNFDRAEVISVYFPLLARTLVLDLRTDESSEPFIRVMPMVGSIEERYRILKKLRPQFSQPEEITLVPWPKYVESLVRLGLWDRLTRRLRDGGFYGSLADAGQALDELRELEHATVQSAIKGRGFRTLWPSTR